MGTACNDTSRRVRRIESVLERLLSGGIPVRQSATVPGAGGTDPCGGGALMPCPPDLVSPQTRASILAGSRVGTVAPIITALAAGARTTAVIIPSNGLRRQLSIVDLVSSLSSLDDTYITIAVSGVTRFQLFGGRFARNNANSAVTAAGLSTEVGPIESMTIEVQNVSSAAFAAGATMTVQYQSTYPGEPGFVGGTCCPPQPCDAAADNGGTTMTITRA